MNGKFLLFGRDETENSLMHFVDRKISDNDETSGDTPSSEPQSIESRQENRA
jgi:hypothetical protein